MTRLAALAWALLAVAPALALAQAAGSPGDPSAPVRPEGFSRAPLGPDGRPVEYVPPQPPRPDLVPAPGAELRLLDKMTGRVETFAMASGEVRVAERLEIALHACRATPPGEAPESVAHLTIRDLREEAPRFDGWMFASSPALSALDHARYDVWVLSCSTSSAEASSGRE